MPPHHRRVVATIVNSSAHESLWITDRVLQASLTRFTRTCPSYHRHGSSVPGPLEAQRRRRGRKMTSFSSSSAIPEFGLDWTPLESALDSVQKRLRELRPTIPNAFDWTREPTTTDRQQEAEAEESMPASMLRKRSNSVDRSAVYSQLMELAEDGVSRQDPEWRRLEAILCTKHKNHATQYLRSIDDEHLCDLFFQYFAPADWQPIATRNTPDAADNSELTPFTRTILRESSGPGSVDKVLPEMSRYLVGCRRVDILIQTLSQLSARKASIGRMTLQRVCSQLVKSDPQLAAAVVVALNSTDFISIEMIIRKALETRTLPSKKLVNLSVRASKSDSWLPKKDERYFKRQQKLTDLVHDVATYVVEDPGLGNRVAWKLLDRLFSIEALIQRPSLADQLVLVGLTRPLSVAEQIPADRIRSILGHVARVKGLAAAEAIRQSLLLKDG